MTTNATQEPRVDHLQVAAAEIRHARKLRDIKAPYSQWLQAVERAQEALRLERERRAV